MKLRLTLSLLAVYAASAFAQTERVDLTADKLVRDSSQVHATGHARARFGTLVLLADEATLQNETGKLEMRGHVHITLPERENHTVVRYNTAVLLTDQPVGVTADRATVKDGLLQAAGNIVVVPVDPELANVRLRGDELTVYLRIGDATLRGNVRPSGGPAPAATPTGFRVPNRVFPPEIIK